jgi:hypothetical protein
MRVLEVRMSLKQTHMICLQRGYFSRNETNLRSNRVFYRACLHHPIEVVDIFLECFHKHWMLPKAPND